MTIKASERYKPGSTDPTRKTGGAGFVTNEKHWSKTEQISSKELIETLRLDYKGTNFSASEGYAELIINDVQKRGLKVNHAFDKELDPPYTNTGMSGTDKTIMVEYYVSEDFTFMTGDILNLYDMNGNMVGKRTYNDDLGEWIEIGL